MAERHIARVWLALLASLLAGSTYVLGQGVVRRDGADAAPPADGQQVKQEGSDNQKEQTRPEQGESLKIAKGDVLLIQVKEDAGVLNDQYLVNTKGVVEFKYVGEVAAEGLTPAELADKLKARLEQDFLKSATVYVESRGPIGGALTARGGVPLPAPGIVYVMGKVRNPGAIQIPPEEKNFTISKAIIRAGGAADFAKLSKTKLVRKRPDGQTDETTVNCYDIIVKGKLELDVPIQKDDWIIVPEGMFPGPS